MNSDNSVASDGDNADASSEKTGSICHLLLFLVVMVVKRPGKDKEKSLKPG